MSDKTYLDLPLFDDAHRALERELDAWCAQHLHVDHGDTDAACRALVRQLGNIKALPTKAAYSSFAQADPKVGDDLFDAACAGVWALVTRGMDDVPTVIGHRTQSREALLGHAAPGLPA